MSKELIVVFEELNLEEVIKQLKNDIDRGDDPLHILNECRQAMDIIGKKYQEGKYFLAELMLSAEIFKEVTSILKPYLDKQRTKKGIGKVVLATLRGDIHDLGKNIVATLLTAYGFEVYDLGVDVEPTVVVDKIKEIEPEIVGFSALLTTTFDTMKKAVDLLIETGRRDSVKLIIGGAMTDDDVKAYVGADFQTKNAMEGVEYCVNVIKEN